MTTMLNKSQSNPNLQFLRRSTLCITHGLNPPAAAVGKIAARTNASGTEAERQRHQLDRE
jgi:hypothetical protein